MLGATPVVVIKRDGANRPEVLRVSDFEKLVRSRAEAMKMTKEFTLSTIPEELRGMMSGLMGELDKIIDLVGDMDDNEEVNESNDESSDEECDCPICRGEVDEEDIMMIGKIIEDITGGAIRLGGIEIVKG